MHASLAAPVMATEFLEDGMIPSVWERASVKIARRPSNSWSVISDYMTIEVDKGGTGDSSSKVVQKAEEEDAPAEVVMIEEGTEEDL